MGQPLDLKALERQTFTSRFQDGLTDLQIGLMLSLIWFVGTFGPRLSEPDHTGLMMLGGFVVVMTSVPLLKRFVIRPRMGTFRAAPPRRRRLRIGAMALLVMVLLQVGLVGVQAVGLGLSEFTRLQQAVLLGLAFTIPWAAFSWFNSFERGYLQALLLGGSIAFEITFNNGTGFLVSGVLLTVIGLYIFVRFLHDNPLPQESDDVSAA